MEVDPAAMSLAGVRHPENVGETPWLKRITAAQSFLVCASSTANVACRASFGSSKVQGSSSLTLARGQHVKVLPFELSSTSLEMS